MENRTGIVRCAIFRKVADNYELLLCERADFSEWEFPGGGININEFDEPTETPLEAIVREVREETSIALQERHLKFVTSLPHPLNPEINPHYVRFYATAFFSGTPNPDNDEVSECLWTPITETTALPLTSLTKHLLSTLPMFKKYLATKIL
jgi:8-oxo-dGTP pyrophosphatase MutT (NUDIX family)